MVLNTASLARLSSRSMRRSTVTSFSSLTKRCGSRGPIGFRILALLEEMLEKPVWRVQKVARDQVVLRLLIGNRLNRVSVEIENDRPWVGQENRRVCRDQELRVPRCREIVDDPQK